MFVIAVQDGDGNLKIIGWNVDKESLEVTRLGSATAGAVSLISCCRYPFLDEFFLGFLSRLFGMAVATSRL